MARYVPRHSREYREKERMRPLTRMARKWSLVVAVVLVVFVGLVIALGGGLDEAWRTFSGQELIEKEMELRRQWEGQEASAPANGEATGVAPAAEASAAGDSGSGE